MPQNDGTATGLADDFGIDGQSGDEGLGELSFGEQITDGDSGGQNNDNQIPTEDNTDTGDELIAGKFKTVADLADAYSNLEKQTQDLQKKAQDDRQAEIQNQIQTQKDAKSAELDSLVASLSNSLDPDTVKALTRLTDLKAEMRVEERTAPLESVTYQVGAKLELNQLQAEYGETYAKIFPKAQQIFQENPVLGLSNAFKLANADYVTQEAMQQNANQNIDNEKHQAHTKTTGIKAPARETDEQALFKLVKNAGRTGAQASEAADLGIE